MNTHVVKAQESQSQSMANAADQKPMGESMLPQLGDPSERVAQGKRQGITPTARIKQLMAMHKIANNSPQAKKYTQMQAMADNSPAQRKQAIQRKENPLAAKAGHPSKVIQLKESAKLVAGGLNMIGETHSEYTGKVDRGREANKIRSVLGPDNVYLTEGMLKTSGSEEDYADPIYLRLEQVFGFVLEEGSVLLAAMKGIDPESLVLKTKAAVAAREKLGKIAAGFVSEIAKPDFNLEAVLESVRKLGLAKPELEQLGSTSPWDLSKMDPDGTYAENFYAVQEGISGLADEIDDEDDPMVAENPFNKAIGLVNVDFYAFYDKYKGRLAPTLRLYYDLKKKRHVTTQLTRFNFDIAFIKPLLDEWEKIDQLKGIVVDTMNGQKHELIPDLLGATIRKISKLIELIRGGQKGTGSEDSTEVIRRHRSIEMDEAAEKLKGQNIAWKVGNLHVEDIKFMESVRMTNPGYTYITKDNFKASLRDVPELDPSMDAGLKVGAAYLQDEENKRKITENVNKDLAQQ